MTTRIDETVISRTYTLSCVDCSFETDVEGDVFDVLDAIDVHQEKRANDAFKHFVEFEAEEMR